MKKGIKKGKRRGVLKLGHAGTRRSLLWRPWLYRNGVSTVGADFACCVVFVELCVLMVYVSPMIVVSSQLEDASFYGTALTCSSTSLDSFCNGKTWTKSPRRWSSTWLRMRRCVRQLHTFRPERQRNLDQHYRRLSLNKHFQPEHELSKQPSSQTKSVGMFAVCFPGG